MSCKLDFSEIGRKSDFSSSFEKHYLDECCFEKLLPKFRLKGLKLLLKNGSFAEFDVSLLQSEQAGERMKQYLLKASDISIKKKKFKLERDINDIRQALLASFFTHKN